MRLRKVVQSSDRVVSTFRKYSEVKHEVPCENNDTTCQGSVNQQKREKPKRYMEIIYTKKNFRWELSQRIGCSFLLLQTADLSHYATDTALFETLYAKFFHLAYCKLEPQTPWH